jgi:hypothetical protein
MNRTLSSTTLRRFGAPVLLLALVFSFGAALEVSLCPPGMEMGMDMGMDMARAPGVAVHDPGSQDPRSQHADGMHCVFPATVTQDGAPSCPLAVGGVGPCGVTAPAPAAGALFSGQTLAAHSFLPDALGQISDQSTVVPLPPPRS